MPLRPPITPLKSALFVAAATLLAVQPSVAQSPFGDGSDGPLVVRDATLNLADRPEAARFLVSESIDRGARTIPLSSDPRGALAAGDEIMLVHQSGGLENTIRVGLFEFGVVTEVTPEAVTVSEGLTRSYDTQTSAVTVYRVPHYTAVHIGRGATLTTTGWNGQSGGLLVMRASQGIEITDGGSLRVDGLGYRGGQRNPRGSGGQHGETLTGFNGDTFGAGAACGSPSANSSGGAGAHASDGRDGASSNQAACHTPSGGARYGTAQVKRIHMGSGGASGSASLTDEVLTPGAGGSGGGVIFLSTPELTVTGDSVLSANGQGGQSSGLAIGDGGAGAGGSVRLTALNFLLEAGSVEALGGAGGGEGRIRLDVVATVNGHAPGAQAFDRAVAQASSPAVGHVEDHSTLGNINDSETCPENDDPQEIDFDGDGFVDVCDPDDDDDTVDDQEDNCVAVPNTDQLNHDDDPLGDACDDDDDNDGHTDAQDNCPVVPNPDQTDIDGDGFGDLCDEDTDNDGTNDDADNCPAIPNPPQEDTDDDGVGDSCDDDDDGDTIVDGEDNCPLTSNTTQLDTDSDSFGDACDGDDDDDDIDDEDDNCPVTPNFDQADLDGDRIGDVCDDDMDGDLSNDEVDNCFGLRNPDQADLDGDEVGDLCDGDLDGDAVPNEQDNCPRLPNPDQRDDNEDGIGDDCDGDEDDDGIVDGQDNCPLEPNPDQLDRDADTEGDACDDDIDGDLLDNAAEGRLGTDPEDADTDDDGIIDGEESVSDRDLDGLRDALDPDSDNDGIGDGVEAGRTSPHRDTDPDRFTADSDPSTTTETNSADTDGDGLLDGEEDTNHNGRLDAGETDPNVPDLPEEAQEDPRHDQREDEATMPIDHDVDDDGVLNDRDNCQTIGNEDQLDTDSDGFGDICDDDDDNDGVTDLDERAAGTDPALADTDGDGIPDGEELAKGTNPTDPRDGPVIDIAVVSSAGTCACTQAAANDPPPSWLVIALMGVYVAIRRRQRG